QALNIQAEGIYVDCTFGRGGHSKMILQQLADNGRLFAIDRDPAAIDSLLNEFYQDPRFSLEKGRFSGLLEFTRKHRITGRVAGILLDLGVSSPQLDDAGRGFSFRNQAALDMRMDNSSGMTAADWVNSASEVEITNILRVYGEEKFAKRIARAIVQARKDERIESTTRLAELIAKAVPVHEKDKHPATRSFQAIRIRINEELDELRAVLVQALETLGHKGRLVVISFHSLEDRIVKRFMREHSRGDSYPPDIPVTADQLHPKLKIINKAVYPTEDEIRKNPRARSAVLRTAERIRE
ncbi:MAG: 16S rRNA (cytosine(1402)-N(4))-methyltransferase RsmH, partial [Gammaproteobacteria bacterium]